jgi:hypothetical protein
VNDDLDLEQRYRRVLRLLPRYYRDTWEEDMVAAFLDGSGQAVPGPPVLCPARIRPSSFTACWSHPADRGGVSGHACLASTRPSGSGLAASSSRAACQAGSPG